jgi:AcrR family transcriptional regulator
VTTRPVAGRPRASSRETIAEAACELFLERGYEQTSVSDIAQRAGLSRSSFFNYFEAKSDVVWYALDERIAALEERVAMPGADPVAEVRVLLREFAPGSLALAIAQADAMGARDELDRDAALRLARLTRAIGGCLARAGADELDAAATGGAVAAVVIQGIVVWASAGAGSRSLAEIALPALDRLP